MMRPDDLHLAMRSDLVLILKDVVGLIARIEASIPGTGECAPRPVGDGEGTAILSPDLVKPSVVRSDGGYSVDPEAQKDSVDRTGRRNEGVGRSGALAGAETSPNLGQPISDQPLAAALPPSIAPAAPAALANVQRPARQEAPQPTRTERVLDIWATTDLTDKQIASRVGCAIGSVMGFVYAARKKGDPRAFARKLAHDDKLSEPPAPKPTLIKRGDDEPTVAGFAKPVERKPFDRPKSSPYDPRPGRIVGVTITSPGSVVSLDMGNFVVACPGGDWQVTRPVALVMERMRNGDTFADNTLAELGSMGAESFSESRKRWAEDLAKLGITFVHTKHVGCRIEVAK